MPWQKSLMFPPYIPPSNQSLFHSKKPRIRAFCGLCFPAKPRLGSVWVPTTPSLIENSWSFCMKTGSGSTFTTTHRRRSPILVKKGLRRICFLGETGDYRWVTGLVPVEKKMIYSGFNLSPDWRKLDSTFLFHRKRCQHLTKIPY
jgi:hypothetical protein